MFFRILKTIRAVGYGFALLVLSGVPLRADSPSDCPQTAIGGQTGYSYTLQSQSLVTESRTVQLSVGGTSCGVTGGTGGTYSEQYHVGYYRSPDVDRTAVVDCRTGRITGWV